MRLSGLSDATPGLPSQAYAKEPNSEDGMSGALRGPQRKENIAKLDRLYPPEEIIQVQVLDAVPLFE